MEDATGSCIRAHCLCVAVEAAMKLFQHMEHFSAYRTHGIQRYDIGIECMLRHLNESSVGHHSAT